MLSPARPLFCTNCGQPWPDPDAPWPRTCQPAPHAHPVLGAVEQLAQRVLGTLGCGKTTWKNLVPVAVLVVPLEDLPGQYLGVRRAIQPALGETVLPSGFMEAPPLPLDPGEAELHWLAEAARELKEEAGLDLNPAALRVLHVASAPSNPSNLLLFVEAPPACFRLVQARFVPNDEVSELVPLGPGSAIPWSTHRDALRAHADRVALHTELLLLRNLRDAVLVPHDRAGITEALHRLSVVQPTTRGA